MSIIQLYPTSSEENSEQPTTLNKPPIILLPGIFGDSKEVTFLAKAIYENCQQQRIIYAFKYGRLDQENSNKITDINSIVDALVEELINLSEFKPFPFILVGYSHGCTIGVLAALKLKKLGHDPHVFLIDGTAPEVSQDYYTSSSIKAVNDLLLILNYAAAQSDLTLLELDQQSILKLASVSFADQFDTIKRRILRLNKKADEDSRTHFEEYAENARQNLNDLTKGTWPNYNAKLDNINILLVDDTAKKFGIENGGWNNYSKTINPISEPKLKQLKKELTKKQHVELLKEENCKHLADVITYTIEKEIDPQKVIENAIAYHLNLIQQAHPDVDVRKAAKAYVDRSPDLVTTSANESVDNSSDEEFANASLSKEEIEPNSPLSSPKEQKKLTQQFGIFASSAPDSPKENLMRIRKKDHNDNFVSGISGSPRMG